MSYQLYIGAKVFLILALIMKSRASDLNHIDAMERLALLNRITLLTSYTRIPSTTRSV